MVVAPADIEETLTSIWSTVLELEATVTEPPDFSETSETYAGSILVNGGRDVAVVMVCDTEVAERAAAVMFDTPVSEVSDEDARDAFGELINVFGGNLKSLIENAKALSLPTVVGGREIVVNILGAQVIARHGFQVDGGHLLLEIYEGEAAPVKTAQGAQ